MAVLHLLGTGAGFSDADRTTTMLAFENQGQTLVVDCGGDVIQRLLVSRIHPDSIEAMIVTHEHADHVSGFPLFMEKIWLAGRRRPIPVIGIEPALAQARRSWESFDTKTWKDVPEIDWRTVEHRAGAEVLRNERWNVTAAPGIHSVPVIGVRVEAIGAGTVAYSCDTDVAEPIAEMARGADILVHEAMKEKFPGVHTTYEEAAEVARGAGAGRLILIHLPYGVAESDIEGARKIFPNTELAADGARYDF